MRRSPTGSPSSTSLHSTSGRRSPSLHQLAPRRQWIPSSATAAHLVRDCVMRTGYGGYCVATGSIVRSQFSCVTDQEWLLVGAWPGPPSAVHHPDCSAQLSSLTPRRRLVGERVQDRAQLRRCRELWGRCALPGEECLRGRFCPHSLDTGREMSSLVCSCTFAAS